MRVVVGLGNPGSEYAGSRHNVGFAVISELARRWDVSLGRPRHGVRAGRGTVAGKHVALIEPQRYMNLSGPALAGSGHRIEPKQLIVVHDDLDLEAGRVRVKRGGGTAGHHGLDSIVERYGSDFVRVRVGVGRPGNGADTVDHLLSRVEKDEEPVIEEAVARAADAVECIITQGEETAMNAFNVRSRARRAAEPVGRN